MKIDKENTIQSPVAAVQGPGARWPDWWNSLSPGERKIICSLMRLLRGAKRSQLRDVARAAAKWERGIGCFIKVRLMNGYIRSVQVADFRAPLQGRRKKAHDN
jgi:hypothetical protein